MTVRASRSTLVIAGACVALVVVAILSLGIGTVAVSPTQLYRAFVTSPEPEFVDIVLRQIRLPRFICAVLIGSNLSLSGVLLQGTLRNPLASPRVIGVNAGAGLAAVAIMVIAPAASWALAPAAFAGALVAAVAVLLLSEQSSLGPTAGIVLAGVAISALLQAFTSGLMLLNSDDLDITYSWLIGGLNGRGWGHVMRLLPYSLAGGFIALILAPKLDLFALGDESAAALGLRVAVYRTVNLMAAALLAGSAISVGGTIGFVGLIAPHSARLLLGNEYRRVVLLSPLLGALLLSLSDLVARTVFLPVELPVGVVTATLGAPFFLLLLRRAGSGPGTKNASYQ